MDSTLVNSATGSCIGSKKLLGTFLRVNGESFTGSGEIGFVDVEPGKTGNLHPLCGEGGGANAGEGVKEVPGFVDRIRHQDYGRTVLARLLPAGRTAAQAGAEALAAIEYGLEGLQPEERDRVAEALVEFRAANGDFA